MKLKLFGSGVSPACEYCIYGEKKSDGTGVLCRHKGVMPLEGSCKKYKYDPLRREPKRLPDLPTYNEEDFKI